MLKSAKSGALDIENFEDVLISVAVTVDGETAYVLDCRSTEPIYEARQLSAVGVQLRRVPWIMHNGAYDYGFMRSKGVELNLAHDTMALAYLLNQSDPRAKTSRKGLEHLAVTILGEKPWKDVDYKRILDEPFEKVAAMNGRDAIFAYRLYAPLMARVEANAQLHMIYKWVLMPAVRQLVLVTENGVPVDEDNLATLTKELEEEQAGLLKWLQANTPEPKAEKFPKGWPKHKQLGTAFNPGSPAQVAHILFDIRRLRPPVETATGRPSTNNDSLLQLALAEPDEWIDQLLAYRKVTTALNSFLLKWPGMLDEGGRLHPRYKPLHVVTGRLSSEEPNIQNVPRDKRFRDCFGTPALSWVKADYSQIELRLAAWLAGEPRMLEAYRTGQDLHALTARLVLGDESPDARHVGKTLNFALLYGAGPKTLQRIARVNYDLNLSLPEAKRHSKAFHAAYPELGEWHQRMTRRIVADGISVSPLGRIRQLPEAKWYRHEDEELRKAGWHAVAEGINHPVQGFASDLLLVAMLRVARIVDKYGASIVCEVHDELDCLCPPENVEPFAREVKTIMEDASWLSNFGVSLGVPLVADVSAGSHWGSQTPVSI